MKIIFLGTGGSRQMLMTQERKTGGIFFDMDKTKFIVDPGPGSILNALSVGIDPGKLDGVVVSHLHIDHCTDANVYLDAIEKPFIIAEEHCLLMKKANFEYFPCITAYHQKKSKVYAVKDGDMVTVGNVKLKAVKMKHYEPTMGFRIVSGDVDVGYVSDGAYYRGMEKHFDGCKVLIFNVIVPKGQTAQKDEYMSVDGVISFLNGLSIKPKMVILTHLNSWMLRSNLWKQEKIIQEATKLKNVIHAEDFMSLDLSTLQTSVAKSSKDKLKL